MASKLLRFVDTRHRQGTQVHEARCGRVVIPAPERFIWAEYIQQECACRNAFDVDRSVCLLLTVALAIVDAIRSSCDLFGPTNMTRTN